MANPSQVRAGVHVVHPPAKQRGSTSTTHVMSEPLIGWSVHWRVTPRATAAAAHFDILKKFQRVLIAISDVSNFNCPKFRKNNQN